MALKLLPRNIEFFELLREQARHIHASSDLLLANTSGTDSLPEKVVLVIAESERSCGAIARLILDRLRQTFITPIDPEDLQTLCRRLDLVMDGIEQAAHCLLRYRIQPIPAPVSALLECLLEATAEIAGAMDALDDFAAVERHCREIGAAGSRADAIVREAILELLDNEPDPVRIIKLKQIYGVLEVSVDACEDVADALRHVLVKNS